MSRPATRFAGLLAVVALLSCNDDSTPTQPAGAPAPAAPEFALAPNSWGDPMPPGRVGVAAASVVSLAGPERILAMGGSSTDGDWGVRDNEVYVP